jgi:uncharacterized protein YqgC (DUF456 family)
MRSAQLIAKRKRPVSVWRLAFGWAMICAGIAGILLPVIPGIPMLIAGFVVLSARYRWAAWCVLWCRRKLRQAAALRQPAAV